MTERRPNSYLTNLLHYSLRVPVRPTPAPPPKYSWVDRELSDQRVQYMDYDDDAGGGGYGGGGYGGGDDEDISQHPSTVAPPRQDEGDFYSEGMQVYQGIFVEKSNHLTRQVVLPFVGIEMRAHASVWWGNRQCFFCIQQIHATSLPISHQHNST